MIRFRALLSALLTILLLTGAWFAAPVAARQATASSTGMSAIERAATDKSTSANDDGDDEDTDQNDDQDNGKGNDDKKDDENGKDNNGKGKGKGNKGEELTPAKPYRVDVACDLDPAANTTTCAFTGIAPSGAKKIGHIDLPAAEVCAEVIGGDYDYVDPDPNTGVTGYKSRGSAGAFSLVLTGDVTPGGNATYWFKTGDGVFPATGPGLVCASEESQPSAPAAPATATPAATTTTTPAVPSTTPTAPAASSETGAITVQTYRCAETPPTDDYDWYGRCEPGGETVRFTLDLLQETGYTPVSAGETTTGGEFHIAGLVPGTYHLDAVDSTWCHAESDHVDAQGDLVVDAGADVTVWIFFCSQPSGS